MPIARYIPKQLRGSFGKYLVVGVGGFIFELSVIVASQAFGATPVLAVTISYWLGTAVGFFLQKLISFKDTRMHHRILVPQIIAIALLVFFNYLFTAGLTWLLDDHLPTTVIRTLALAMTVLWNYFIYKYLIFNQQVNTNN